MLTAFVLACALNRIGQQPMPVVPAGADRTFQATVQKVVDATNAKDWEKAARLADRLPEDKVAIQLDFAGVPEIRRPGFRAAVQKAVEVWKAALPHFTVTVAEKGQIKIGFVDKLPPDETTKLPKGLVSFVSDDPADPRVEGVVALHRVNDTTSIDDIHVQNETVFLIGQYLGLGQLPPGTSAMARADTIANYPHAVNGAEKGAAVGDLELAAFLRKAVKDRKQVYAGKAHTRVNPTVVDFGEVTQGQPAYGVFEVTNLGDGRSALQVVPDCSCFSIRATSILSPGENTRVTFGADTTMFPGPFHKQLYVTTSDPDRPMTIVEVKGNVKPAYRFLRDKGRGLVYMEDDSGKATYYLALAKGVDLKVKRVYVQGLNAAVAFEPWSGKMADPELGGPTEDRHGYKIDLLISPGSVTGRMLATLVVETDDKVWHHLYHAFNVQRGIAADPGQLYLGLIDKAPRRYAVFVTRPGRPFTVKGASVDNDHLKVWPERVSSDTWRVVAEFDGKALTGSLSGTIKIRTDDNAQPLIEVPVAAEVR
ncbi:MAG: DUF1573 domain-containing protein [Fimbriimonadaceae bacterium]|nr:DUF1573 domain-containing protein [Fimbriimonadaceae bacterium]